MLKAGALSLFLTLSCIFPQAWAQEDIIRADHTEHLGRSAEARQDKNIQVNFQAVGYGPGLTNASGFQLGVFINPQNLFILEGTSGKGAFISVFNDYDVRSSSFGVHFKHFAGNSFYWRAGVDYRKVNLKYNYWFSNDNYQFEGNSTALNFQIGNQWQWDTFTMGCDWVGYSLPISHNVSSESVNSATPSSYTTQNMRDDEDTYLSKGSLNLVRFYIGLSF